MRRRIGRLRITCRSSKCRDGAGFPFLQDGGRRIGQTSAMPNSTVIPGAMYRNAPAAIDWLCDVFGFERHAVHPGPNNTIMHAELTLGGGMMMLGTVPPQPREHEICLIVPDPDA